MSRASDLSYVHSLQPSSSQFPRDEEAVERAFWQSTPTALEELRQGTEDEHHQAVSKDQDRPNDPLSLSTQQSRLIRQTWTSVTAGSIASRSSDGKTRMPSRPKYRNRRGGGATARPDSTNNITSASTVPSTDKSKSMMFFRHLKNIEKVSKTVDEKMLKRKVQKEWSTKVISETARLRDGDDSEEGDLKEKNVNTNMHTTSERPPSNDNADTAPRVAVDAFDDDDDDNDNDLLGLGTPQSQSDDRDPESMEEEVVPTSQSQERYLSPLPAYRSTATTQVCR